ncbi:MAG TPA: diiron oxygenase [Acidimicrobiales bacterium]|nr:diiron oxygenase [Acidimicrobiales bacterium]
MTVTLNRTDNHWAGSHQAGTFEAQVGRLNRQSVDRHFDAYADVDWESAELTVDPTDPRWVLWDTDPLAQTGWYRAQPEEGRARIGLLRVAVGMRTGWEFENILQRGLLGYAFRLPNGRPEFRYLHHEVAEESQHTMMFQEFVNRSGLPVRGLPKPLKLLAEWGVIPLNRLFPPLFFLFVLGGEDPIDHVQRQRLRAGVPHPLVERIMRIHVTEEARHLSFARRYLKEKVPRLGWARRQVLALAAPALLGVMARQMLFPSGSFGRAGGIPDAVLRQARHSAEADALLRASVAKVRRLCGELGLLHPVSRTLWRAFGIWDDGPTETEGIAKPAGNLPTAAR